MEVETSSFQALKLGIDSLLPIGRPLQHLLAGALLVGLGLSIAPVRRSGRLSALLLLAILAFALAAEAIDLSDDLRGLGYRRWGESAKDVLLTLAVPLLALALRFWLRSPLRRG